ncbi:hypothetical protein DFH27DRAFT_609696 [Peziza echinospora]|nr:hypothetical protein DFH27DRAFT_609696 [Peziza echinospora]
MPSYILQTFVSKALERLTSDMLPLNAIQPFLGLKTNKAILEACVLRGEANCYLNQAKDYSTMMDVYIGRMNLHLGDGGRLAQYAEAFNRVRIEATKCIGKCAMAINESLRLYAKGMAALTAAREAKRPSA